jgi:hypothetical protein
MELTGSRYIGKRPLCCGTWKSENRRVTLRGTPDQMRAIFDRRTVGN